MMASVDNMDVLIIEDSAATAGVISDYLKQLNYKRIHICKDGKAGIKKFLELLIMQLQPLIVQQIEKQYDEFVTVFGKNLGKWW